MSDETKANTQHANGEDENERFGRIAYEEFEMWKCSLAPGGLMQFDDKEKWDDLYSGLKRCWIRAAMAVRKAD